MMATIINTEHVDVATNSSKEYVDEVKHLYV
jgi:hypothetical protein